MILKKGVKLTGVRPELVIALQVVAAVYHQYGHMAVITSVVDGTHSRNSLHYSGGAADVRTRDIPPGTQTQILQEIKSRLTSDFDVILESDHFHIEYQPRQN